MGDGFLAEFPVATDAVECAFRIQDLSNDRRSRGDPLRLRIGVHVGNVLQQADGDLFGDTVNISARLEALAETGSICISGAVYDHLNAHLQKHFQSYGPQALKNIRKTITIYGTLGVRLSPVVSSYLSEKPSLLVLPFRDIGESAAESYFADGVVEDLITHLVSYKWLYVLGRNSTFSIQSQSRIAEVNAHIGVRYVLKGSVRRFGSQIRLTAQLMEAKTARSIWGKTFDGSLSDIFALQDEITTGIVSTIEPAIRHSEMTRLRKKNTTDFDAYDLYLHGLKHFYRNDRPSIDAARGFFEQAITRDRDYAEAWAMSANCASRAALDGWTDHVDLAASQACEAASIAVRLDEGNGIVLAWASWVLALMGGHLDESKDLADRAIHLVPNSATALGLVSWVYLWNADFEKTLATLAKAAKLDPLDPRRAYMRGATAFTYFFQERYADAIAISD